LIVLHNRYSAAALGHLGAVHKGVFASEGAALNFIRTRIARGTTVYADEAGAWNELHGRFTMHRINHQEAYSLGDGVYTNNAESFFSRMRRAEIGHHHHLAGPYLAGSRKRALGARIIGAIRMAPK
jgi:hypothetical protein